MTVDAGLALGTEMPRSKYRVGFLPPSALLHSQGRGAGGGTSMKERSE